MRSLIAILSILLISFVFSTTVTAQERATDEPRLSPNAMVSQTIGTTVVSVTYGRPGVRDRVIFDDEGLVPFGAIWRTGADEATTISFTNDVRIEGELIEEGLYSLFTIPEEDTWTIIFNRVADQWGGYNYEEAEDVLRVEVDSEEGHYMDQLMFYFEKIDDESGNMVIHWDNTKVSILVEPVE